MHISRHGDGRSNATKRFCVTGISWLNVHSYASNSKLFLTVAPNTFSRRMLCCGFRFTRNQIQWNESHELISCNSHTVWSPSLVLDVRLYSVFFRLNSSVFFLFRGQLITTNYNVYSRFELKYDKSNSITVSMRALSYHSDDGPWKLYSCHFFSMNLIRSLELGSTKSRRKSLK